MRPLKINRELAFKKWVEFGRLDAVRDWLFTQGIYNQRTGKPFSRAAVSKAARRWVCLNAEEARTHYNQHGWYPTDEEWHDWIIHTAIKTFHSHKIEIFRKIITDNNLEDRYGYLLGTEAQS